MSLLLLAAPAFAQSTPPIRRTRLQDGREFVAEVLGTEATGLRVRVPAGEMLVSFEDLLEVRPIDAAAYAAQGSWRVVVVAPEGILPATRQMLDTIPGLVARPAGQPDADLTPAQVAAVGACGPDLGCMRDATKDLPWRWLVVVEDVEAGGIKVSSLVSTADRTVPQVQAVPVVEAAALWTALHRAVGLDAPKSAPPVVEGLGGKVPKTPKGPKTYGPATAASAAQVFVPVPGWPSFRSGDAGKGAAALLGATAFTVAAGVAGVSMNPSSDVPSSLPMAQGIGFAVGGYLGSTWALNHWLAGSSNRTAGGVGASVVPTTNGAVVVGAF